MTQIIAQAKGDTFVIVASCPETQMDAVRAKAKSNRNVMLGFSTKDDYRPGQVTKAMGAMFLASAPSGNRCATFGPRYAAC